MAKATITVYSGKQGDTCPPGEDFGGKVKLDNTWNYFESGTETKAEFQVDAGTSHTVYVKGPASRKPGWEPVEGQYPTGTVPATGTIICTEWKPIEARKLEALVTGEYTAKRVDQAKTFNVRITASRNDDYCLYLRIAAPGAIDRGEGHIHTKTESGRHGAVPHAGDFMQGNAPLTDGFLQGTFRGPRGEEGSFRMALALLPAPKGLYTVFFGGFLTFASQPQQNIETTFTRRDPAQWPSGPGMPV